MIVILSNFFLFLFLVFGNGFFVYEKIIKGSNEPNFYEISLLGFIFTIFLSQLINFFLPLNNYVTLLNIILITLFLMVKKNKISELKIDYKFSIIFFILVIFNIFSSDFSEDLNHYHYGIISNADKFNLIWGNSFFHDIYGTNPIWLITHSYLNFDSTRLQDIHVQNGLLLFIFIGLFFSAIKKLNNVNSANKILFFAILFFIFIKFTRIKEFGIDRPVILFFCSMIYYYLKYIINQEDKYFINNFIIISLISIVIISIKITYLPILIFPIFIIIKHKKQLYVLNKKYFLVILALCIFILKNFLSTGCIVYPVTFTCLDFISWSNSEGASNLAFLGEYFNKSWTSYEGLLTKSEYIKNFNWFHTWFNRGKIEILELLLTSFVVVLLSIFMFGFNKNLKNFSKNEYYFLIKILSLIVFSSLLIYFFKNPVIRMNYHVLISLIIIFIILMVNIREDKNNTQKIFIILIVSFSFNLYKNFDRINNNNFINDPLKTIKNKVFKPAKSNLDGFVYYVGWYGNTPIGYKTLKNKKYQKKLIFNIISNK